MVDLLYSIIAAALVVSALLWRKRINSCLLVHHGTQSAVPEYHVLLSEGTVVDESVIRDASRCAHAYDRDVLDLLPCDLPAEELLAVMQMYSPARYRRNRIAAAVSAGYALLVAGNISARSGFQGRQRVSAPAFFAQARRLKKYAPCRADLAISKQLFSAVNAAVPLPERLALIYGNVSTALLSVQLAVIVLLYSGLIAAPLSALAALLALHAQPAIVTLGTSIKPRDLASATMLRSLIMLSASLSGIRTALARRSAAPAVTAARAEYSAAFAAGTERFYSPLKTSCPLCGEHELRELIRTYEPVMHKPGSFTLEQSSACGYIFQNPQLNAEGLAFYYRDLYDGLGASLTELILGSDDAVYRNRARLFSRYCTPARWLDVGGGNGYFCCVARGLWPGATFDGLDLSQGIREAEETGWVDHGYQGQFPDTARSLAGVYDVVSMIQYLEHTVTPEKELSAAHATLCDGGMLILEVPNPDFWPRRFLGRCWFQWLQPQHLHFFSIPNMEKLLRRCGFEPIAWHTSEAHIPIDFMTAALFILRGVAPPAHYPWRPQQGWLYGVWRFTVFTLGSPLIIGGFLVDMLLLPWARLFGMSNNYAVIARRTAPVPEPCE
jgi:SAM-dependent methyltransferase